MNGISTEELAQRWGVSRSRILLLAKDGRIQGARRVGRAWLFPPDAKKPADLRKGSGKPETAAADFRFPLYAFNRYSHEELETLFTGEERALYTAQQAFSRGDHAGALQQLQALRATAVQLPVRAGALYCFCRACIWLIKPREYTDAYNELKALLEKPCPYRRELLLLLYDLDSYTEGTACYAGVFTGKAYHKSAQNYVGLIAAFSDLLAHVEEDQSVNPVPYALLCEKYEDEESFVSAGILHIYIAAMYHVLNRTEECREHMRRGIALCLKQDCLWRVAYLYRYLPGMFDAVLPEPGMEAARAIPELCRQEHECVLALMNGMTVKSLAYELQDMDFMYIYLAGQGLSNKEVAERLKRSVSTVSKRYSALYEQTGAKSKRELVELYRKSLQSFRGKETGEDNNI